MNRGEAATLVEDALGRQAEVYRGDEPDRTPMMVGWVAVSAWTGVEADGDVSRLNIHLRDGQLPTWQLIGLLRAAATQLEATYSRIGWDAE